MMDRLLTDDELILQHGLRELFYAFRKNGGDLQYVAIQVFLDFEKAGWGSINVDRQAMVEWGEVLCNSVHHDRFDARRSACHECTVGLFDMLSEGKAPWETPQ